jgi:hypothetical protein
LRRGHSTVLDAYAAHGRIHPATSSEAALDAVHARWSAAVRDGKDALMMARSRTDVDALNHRARTAAQATGTVRGPVLANSSWREWQAGDLLRTRRNDRRLPVGDTHVRNGDRYQVVAAAPAGGLVVQDLAGRGRTVLPADYLDRHATYGWASTIDGAQGATADVGIVLARPGLDREHLYVAMTRGRHANHAHVTGTTPDPEAEHRPGAASDSPVPTVEDAVRVLQVAAARVGAEQSAHTVLDTVRDLPTGCRANALLPRRPTKPVALRQPVDLNAAPPRPTPYYPEPQRQHIQSLPR